MSERNQKGRPWIQLDCNDPATIGVTITPPNGDLLAMTKAMAIRACQLGSRLEELDSQILEVWEVLKAWASDHRHNISKAFLASRGTGFLFLVVQKESEYNHELEDALTELDILIAQNQEYQLVNLSVLSIPNSSDETIRTFLPSQGSMADDDAHRDGSSVACQS